MDRKTSKYQRRAPLCENNQINVHATYGHNLALSQGDEMPASAIL